MTPENELATLRRRIEDAERAIERITTEDPGETREFVGVTTTVTTYPTVAARVYGIKPGTPSGTESEGSTATVTAGTSVFYAINLGGSIPPTGTPIVYVQADGLFVFRYG